MVMESLSSQQHMNKKRRKLLLCITSFVILMVVLILVYLIVATRYRTPKFRLRSASFTTFQVGNSTDPSFNFVMNSKLAIRNRNFAKYKYKPGKVVFEYWGLAVGQAFFEDDQVRPWRTKKFDATGVVLNSGSLVANNGVIDRLGKDIGEGVLELRSLSELKGKVQDLKVIKKKKYARMNCTMNVVIASRSILNIIC